METDVKYYKTDVLKHKTNNQKSTFVITSK